MKLYSIWWEEEIPLMCSCNDCSKKKKERKKQKRVREMLVLTSFESLERNQSFESEDFSIFQHPPPPDKSSELTHIPTRSLALTLEMSNYFDTPRPAVSRPFYSWRMFVVLPKDAFSKEEWILMFQGSARSLWNMRGALQAALGICSQCNTFHRLAVWKRIAGWETESFSVTMFDRRRQATVSTASVEGMFQKGKPRSIWKPEETKAISLFQILSFLCACQASAAESLLITPLLLLWKHISLLFPSRGEAFKNWEASAMQQKKAWKIQLQQWSGATLLRDSNWGLMLVGPFMTRIWNFLISLSPRACTANISLGSSAKNI